MMCVSVQFSANFLLAQTKDTQKMDLILSKLQLDSFLLGNWRKTHVMVRLQGWQEWKKFLSWCVCTWWRMPELYKSVLYHQLHDETIASLQRVEKRSLGNSFLNAIYVFWRRFDAYIFFLLTFLRSFARVISNYRVFPGQLTARIQKTPISMATVTMTIITMAVTAMRLIALVHLKRWSTSCTLPWERSFTSTCRPPCFSHSMSTTWRCATIYGRSRYFCTLSQQLSHAKRCTDVDQT